MAQGHAPILLARSYGLSEWHSGQVQLIASVYWTCPVFRFQTCPVFRSHVMVC